MAIELIDWLETYRRAWEEKDSAAVADLFTEDGTYRSNIFEEAHQGQDGVFEYWSTVTATQEGARVTMGLALRRRQPCRRGVVDGDARATERRSHCPVASSWSSRTTAGVAAFASTGNSPPEPSDRRPSGGPEPWKSGW